MKKNFTIAIATNDGKRFIKEHFGEAKLYMIYSLSPNSVNLLEVIENNSVEEKMHADPEKAKSVSKILKEKGVKVLVGKAFGGNIVRMKKQFVCVKCDVNKILDIFPFLMIEFENIKYEWEKGEDRDIIVL